MDEFMDKLENKFFDASDGTIRAYKYIIRDYLRFHKVKGYCDIDKDPEKRVPPEMIYAKYIARSNKQKKQDIQDYMVYMKKKHKAAPKTLRLKIAGIRAFMLSNNIKFGNDFYKDYRKMGGGHPITKDKAPTKEEFQKILSFADVRSMALFTVMSSSGLRRGEIVNIKYDPNSDDIKDKNIDFDSNPTSITVEYEMSKNKKPRTTYISNEATGFLESWLDAKPKYLEKYTDHFRTKDGKKIFNRENIDIYKVFPMHPCQVEQILVRLLKEAGLTDKHRGRYMIHAHSLRKWTKTRLSKGGMNSEMIEKILGHTPYLSESYERFTHDEIKQEYKLAMNEVSVFKVAHDEKELKNLKDQLLSVRTELKEKMTPEGFIKTMENLGDKDVLKLVKILNRGKTGIYED